MNEEVNQLIHVYLVIYVMSVCISVLVDVCFYLKKIFVIFLLLLFSLCCAVLSD